MQGSMSWQYNMLWHLQCLCGCSFLLQGKVLKNADTGVCCWEIILVTHREVYWSSGVNHQHFFRTTADILHGQMITGLEIDFVLNLLASKPDSVSCFLFVPCWLIWITPLINSIIWAKSSPWRLIPLHSCFNSTKAIHFVSQCCTDECLTTNVQPNFIVTIW